MVEVIAAVAGGGLGMGLVTGLYLLIKKRQSDGFTIKSETREKVSIDDNTTIFGYQPKPQTLKDQQSTTPQTTQEQTIKKLDMHGIKAIMLSGSGDIEINSGVMKIIGNYELDFGKETLIIKSKMLHVETNNGSFFNIDKNVLRKEIKTIINLDNFETLHRVSLNGSGDIKVSNIVFEDNAEIILQGSGDINIQSVKFKTVSLTVNGSGDIKTGNDIIAKHIKANVNGSGDITIIKTDSNTIIDKKVKGSGDIKIMNTNKGFNPLLIPR